MLNNKYRNQIAMLDALIANWNVLSSRPVSTTDHAKNKVNISEFYQIDLTHGLCSNVWLWDVAERHVMFSEWEHFSGDASYPIDGSREAFNEDTNKFTVERLRLAKHCRQWLFVNGSPKPTKAEKVESFLNIKGVGGTLFFVIVTLLVYYFLTSL